MDTLDQLGQLARLTRRVEGAYPPVNAPVLFWLYGSALKGYDITEECGNLWAMV